jgi:hypothetical protein
MRCNNSAAWNKHAAPGLHQANGMLADFAKTLKEKSIHSLDVEITGEDRILTLSTCAYDYDDARLVIHAKRVNSP